MADSHLEFSVSLVSMYSFIQIVSLELSVLTYIHTYIRVICIAHINSKESLCASVAKQVSFQRLFESVK